jgi:hypothetical protein
MRFSHFFRRDQREKAQKVYFRFTFLVLFLGGERGKQDGGLS